jgi:hypothetical protein
MGTTAAVVMPTAGSRARIWLGIVLIAAGCLGHLLAARAIGGSYVAYRDHMVGFVGFALITGAIIAGLGRRFWRGRTDITVLTIGVLQALFGLFVYIERFNIA